MTKKEEIFACQFDYDVELFIKNRHKKKEHKSLLNRLKDYIKEINIWKNL